MKQFLTVVFGGLLVVFVVVPLVIGASNIKANSVKLTQKIAYTADEEEGVLTSALDGLHNTSGTITASAYILKDLTTGEVWTEKDSTRILPMASITKLVTAIVARKAVPQKANLLYPLLLVSSNDSAEAIASAFGRKAFLARMNAFVRSIGAYRTYFADSSGLSPLNVSSASDLALIIDWIRKNDPGILDITLMKTKTLGFNTWNNPTHFLSLSYYVGGKNGFTDEANRTSVSLFKLGYKKDTYAVVVLGSNDRDNDVIRLINKVK